jgi:predicted dehydrogenase
MKYALIGAGRISVNHIVAVKAMGDKLDFSGICDIVPEHMDAALKKAEFEQDIPRYTDYRIMLEEQQPDLVAISTESGSHAEIALYCLSHGSHVIIEKPMAMSIQDADALIDTAQKENKTISVCHQNRFNKSIQSIHEALAAGRFGKISHIAAHVRWNRDRNYYDQAPWRGKWSCDGGCLMNQCIHNADIVCWMLGDIEEVFAYTANQQHEYIEGEDLGLALIRAKNGSYGVFEGTVNVFPKNLEETLYVFGEKGTAKAAGTSLNSISEWKFADSLSDEETLMVQQCSENPPNVYGFGHTRYYNDVVSAIKNGRKPLIDGYEGKKALELILAIYKSKKTGLPVQFPVTQFSTTDMV